MLSKLNWKSTNLSFIYLNFKCNIYLIILQTFQKYKIIIVCHLYEPKQFKNFQNCVLYMCKRQKATAVGSPDVNSSTGKKIRKESTPPAVYGMNKGPTVSEHCESSQQKRSELLPSDFLDLDSSML